MRSSRVPGSRRTPTASLCSAEMGAGGSSLCNRSAKWRRTFWMWWSSPLADEWRRYLAQQMELGGAEVVLSGAVQITSGAAEQRDSVPAGSESGQTEEQTGPPPRRPADGWRKGAPPIPGPGLSVESPSVNP